MNTYKLIHLAILLLGLSAGYFANAKGPFSSLENMGNGYLKIASVMTDKGPISGLILKQSICLPQMRVSVQAGYEINDPSSYEHFQNNLQSLVNETVNTFEKLCKHKGQAVSVIGLALIRSIDGSGNIQATQNLGNVTAREQWITRHAQKQKSKALREAKQKRNEQIAKVRQYNHQQKLASTVYTPKFNMNGPFTGLAGDKYLNAIYHGEFELVKQANNNYAISLQKLYALATNNNPGLLGGIISQALSALNIHDSVSAKYLFHYENRFAKCLRSDAETFGVEEKVPGLVATNMLGVEMWRTNGFSKIYTYKVNKEFAHVFRQVGTMNPEAFRLASMLLNSGYPDYRLQVVRGVEQIQSQFACNDPIVKQFESNLRKLY
ncbi:hypothetical protein [Sessilibacter corallicola]|uniref:hypothetical protein n=1 Tax=Sessilibacter corallicola TaxID=2904075 RepID=UPI001E4C69A5|nr:hypothetical protein [Sessilibacter corallicola]MCE2029715.1 hypothetical protein [Sessilibacter corallicola]